MEDNRSGSSAASASPPPSERPSLASDLKSRILAGLALAAVVLGLNWAGLSPFSLLVFVIGIVMSWEWSNIVRGTGQDIAFFVHAASTLTATFLAAIGFAGLGFTAVLAGAIIIFLTQFGTRPLISAAGAVYTGVPAIALLWLRGDEPWGFWAILFVFAVVAATDVAAFFCGRTFGGPKLAPSISPNKTWSGLIGGVSAASAAGALFFLATGGQWFTLALIGGLLGLVAQAGDLAESALKRAFGVKDASNLIPGHGGFMDRADGIVAAAVAAALIALYVNPHAPAQALMLHP
jgi:phosphatidate cytidylyltransferase